jgi:hypothetical protein
MRVYKFLPRQYGLQAIRKRRLKISEIRYLNDPFDLLPFDLSDPELRKGVIATRAEIGQKGGLLCFSRQLHNPVLWAHYAESHRGLCLGFDVPDDLTQMVEYVENPIRLERLDLKTANRMLFTKYEHWRYEDEVRMWATLQQKSGEYFFMDFGEGLRFAEIIVGAGSTVTMRRIQDALGARSNGVKILKARLAYNAFAVVEDEDGFGYPANAATV